MHTTIVETVLPPQNPAYPPLEQQPRRDLALQEMLYRMTLQVTLHIGRILRTRPTAIRGTRQKGRPAG